MLQKICSDAEPYACSAASYNLDLFRKIRDVLVGAEFVACK